MKKCTYSFKAVAMLLLLCLIGQATLLGQATNNTSSSSSTYTGSKAS